MGQADSREGTERVEASGFFRELQIEFLLHELKDPLAVIQNGLHTLLERRERCGPLSERQERILTRILRNTRKVQGMLNDLLEIGRCEAGVFSCSTFHPERVTLAVLREAVEAADQALLERLGPRREGREAEEAFARIGIGVEIDSRVRGSVMFQDETKFRQIVGNLIKNGLRYRRGRVGVRMRVEEERLMLEVSDDGPGIRPEHHEVIFQRYAQVNGGEEASPRGHGLGLAGARIMARRLGGDVEVESEQGSGAKFKLTLPRRFRESPA